MSWIRSALQIALMLIVISASEARRNGPNNRNNRNNKNNKNKEGRGGEECVIFPSNYEKVLRAGTSSFIELGRMDVGRDFHIEMEVKPAPVDHDGNLFAIGSKRKFPYYEWRSKANTTQYLVVEIVYSSVVLTLKALGTYNLHSIEIYRTYPEEYKIGDGNWHKITAWRSPGFWHLQLDGRTPIQEPLRIGPDNSNNGPSDSTDVKLEDQEAFLGGRPGYIDLQFRGLIRNLKINGMKMQLENKNKSDESVLATRCNAKEVKEFETLLKKEKEEIEEKAKEIRSKKTKDPEQSQDSNSQSYNGNSDFDLGADNHYDNDPMQGTIYGV